MSNSEGRTIQPAGWRLSVLCAALLLGGCGSDKGVWGQYIELVRAASRNTFDSPAVTLEQAAAIPYASLGYRLNGGTESLLVLATDTNGDQLWTSVSRVVLVMRDGRITSSVGLPYDRSGLTSPTSTPLPPVSAALKAPFQSTRLMDLPNLGIYAASLTCVSTAKGRQMIRVLGTALPTVRVDETCRSANPSWSFTDSYWLDSDTGFVWQSVQNLHPRGSRVQVRILRPPG